MGKTLVSLKDGTLVEVEVSEDQAEMISGGLTRTVDSTLKSIKPLLVESCQPVIEAWDELQAHTRIEQAEVEIGMAFSVEGNLYITKSTGKANIKIKLTLKPSLSSVN